MIHIALDTSAIQIFLISPQKKKKKKKKYRIRSNYHTVHLGFSKLLKNLF